MKSIDCEPTMIARLFGKKTNHEPFGPRPLAVIVDDEEDLCSLLRVSFEQLGFRVVTANNGETGLALLRVERPAIAVLDVKMPKMNGFQLLATMQQDEELKSVPVIMATSLDGENKYSETQWAERLGIARFFAKPFDPETMAAAAKGIVGA